MINPDAELSRLQAQSLYRSRRVMAGPQGVRPVIDGRRMLAFCSNDYLGLANHPAVIAALREGAGRYGVGSGAAHLVSGHSDAHHRLEEALAAFVDRPRALLFSTGYMANLGVITALAEHGDQILADRLNHASLVDGARLSNARLRRYRHRDVAHLSSLCATSGAALIVTDGIFSMDGDLAPLPALARSARAAGAWLMLDDAHGLGVIGEGGRGTIAHFGVDDADVPILVGTLGKAFGTFGAFVAGSDALIELLIQRARSYIYTTALPPAIAHATSAAMALAIEEHWRRAHLQGMVQRFRTGAKQLGLTLADSQTPIQPLIAGSARLAMNWSRYLEDDGILVTAIRPPTVPQGSARLRVTLSAAHRAEDVDRLLDVLARLPRSEDCPAATGAEETRRAGLAST